MKTKETDQEKFQRHARHYIARSLIQLDTLIADAPDVGESLSQEWKEIQCENFVNTLREIRQNQISALAASYGQSHTVPSLK